MDAWDLDRLHLAAHKPQILRSGEDTNRVIALLLPQGESLQEHDVDERALIFIIKGELLVRADANERILTAPSLIDFDPSERAEIRAITESQLILCLPPGVRGDPKQRGAAEFGLLSAISTTRRFCS